MQDKNSFSIEEEFSGACFGDKRLEKRLRILAKSLSAQPGESFPEAVGSISALEAAYRFLGNSSVTPEDILSPHIESTIHRASTCSRVVIPHDTSTFTFRGDSEREGLGWLTSDSRRHRGRQGFLAHFALAVSRSNSVEPLGVLGFQSFVRTGKPKGKTTLRNSKQIVNELNRWGESVERVENLFPSNIRPIHVMDREADDYQLLSDLCQSKARFVIRIRQNRRNCQLLKNSGPSKLFELLEAAQVRCERTVFLSKRGVKEGFPNIRKTNTPRNSRIAQLEISATSLTLPRTGFAPKYLPERIAVNCVHVREVNAPPETEPVDWKLLTQEPTSTIEDILNIIDDYRARWIIEEFFMALKTGCAFEKRQLESRSSLLNALAVFSPIAWQLLRLRILDRSESELPAKSVLTKAQISVLCAISKRELDESHLSVHQAFTAIADLGGHIPNNGKPGWRVLARGFEKLLAMEIAWLAAKRCDQS
jgi:hypothetical protein